MSGDMGGTVDASDAAAQRADAQRIAITPHAYVSIGVPHWRTCKACGRGANAYVHRSHSGRTIPSEDITPRAAPSEPASSSEGQGAARSGRSAS